MNLYQQLRIQPNAKPSVIEAAYQEALRSIQARHTQGEDVAQERQLLQAAYAVLSDPKQREAYDDRLAASQFNQKPPTSKAQRLTSKNDASPPPPKAQAKRSKFGLGTVFMAMLVFGMAYIFGSITNADSHKETRPPTYDRFSAQTECERFVSDRLKAPSSADFAPMRDLKISGDGNGPWVVEGYVDAQNSFGAKIRNRYSCSVIFNGDRVSLLGLSID